MNNATATKHRYVAKQLSGEHTDVSYYFEEETLDNLFITSYEWFHQWGFRQESHKELIREIEEIKDYFYEIQVKDPYYNNYSSYGELFLDYDLINNIHNGYKIKKLKDFFNSFNYLDFSYRTKEPDTIMAKYLTLKTGDEWDVACVHGFNQGDYVQILYKVDSYPIGVERYGELFLGMYTEFIITDMEHEEEDECLLDSIIVTYSQAFSEEEYLELICELAHIPKEETKLELLS